LTLLTSCLLAFAPLLPVRHSPTGRRVSAHILAEGDAPTLTDLRSLVSVLASSGEVSSADIQEAVFEALAAAATIAEAKASASSSPPVTTLPTTLGDAVKPNTITEARRAFRTAYDTLGRMDPTIAPLKAPTVKFTNVVLDTTCIWKYQYSRVWAVGYTALCDTFLPALQQGATISESDQNAARSAVCFALGMDAAQIAADAQALASSAAAMTEAELLASDDFAAIAKATGYKYTYSFGVGMCLLMQAVGQTPSNATIARWCAALGLDNFKRTIESDFIRPLSIDGIGRFSFEQPGEVIEARLEGSIGMVGDF